MKHWMLGILTIALVAQPASYRAEIEKARAARVAELTADDGWLTVAGLFWLKPGKNVAGSAGTSDIVLPAKAPARLGVFELADGQVTFTADNGAPVTQMQARIEAGEKAYPGPTKKDPRSLRQS